MKKNGIQIYGNNAQPPKNPQLFLKILNSFDLVSWVSDLKKNHCGFSGGCALL